MNRLLTSRLLPLLALLALCWGISGCATADTDATNTSSRPWNQPKGWETGLPSGMYEGR